MSIRVLRPAIGVDIGTGPGRRRREPAL